MLEITSAIFALTTISVFLFTLEKGKIHYANPERTTKTVLAFFGSLAATSITMSALCPSIILIVCLAVWLFVFLQLPAKV